MFVTNRPREAKPHVKEAQGSASWPNPMVDWPHFESVQVATWRLRSHIDSEDEPMPDSRSKPGRMAS
jgi:hypothetical protein